jgi:hypothetical protein
VALRHAALRTVIDLGAADELNEAIDVLAAHRALMAMTELGTRHVQPAPDVGTRMAHSSSLVEFDSDVVAHLVRSATNRRRAGRL